MRRTVRRLLIEKSEERQERKCYAVAALKNLSSQVKSLGPPADAADSRFALRSVSRSLPISSRALAGAAVRARRRRRKCRLGGAVPCVQLLSP